ncbi:hypothetical protein H0H87_003581 [Tephrocybe sp. NHM501043]|nr:hypothetical protein H0H87_003581 [Tephrocybe sp. NHM501043]
MTALTDVLQISPKALEQLNTSPTASIILPAHNQTTPEWPPYDPAPQRFIRHLGSSRNPSPSLDVDEPMSYILDDFDNLHISTGGPRFFGKSSGILLTKDTLELKNICMGKGPGMSPTNGVRQPLANPFDVPASEYPTYTFPDADLIPILIDLYFRHVNRYFPLLHRPTLERSFSSGQHVVDRGFATVLILVCAVAAKYSDDPRVMDDPDGPGQSPDPHSSGWKWFHQAPMVKTTPLTPVVLYDIQIYALVGQFLQASSVPQACWTVVGIGIRVAQDVGAHRRRRREVPTVEDELWNRAFCFDIGMPIECDDEYWEHPDPKQRWRQPTPEKKPSVIAYFNVYIRLNKILAFLLRTVVRICRIISA